MFSLQSDLNYLDQRAREISRQLEELEPVRRAGANVAQAGGYNLREEGGQLVDPVNKKPTIRFEDFFYKKD